MAVHAPESAPVARDATTPRCFGHDLPAELFTSEALDEICRAAERRGALTVQLPDSSRERLGQRPEYTKPRYPILADALERPVHYRIFNTATWGPREHAECRARLQELAGPHPSLGDIPRETVVRVFPPHWLEHPCDVASVTFDVGFYTRNDLRDRKVYDVNWLMRKARLAPGGPGGRSDRLKCMTFDAISTATRRGLQYRGRV